MTGDAGSRRCAVAGAPIGHSLSPVLHQAGYRELGLPGWSYQAIECDAQHLPGLVASCGPEWAGLSLTMPLKQAVLPLLTEAEPLVSQVGAANTLIFAGGTRRGYNTDVPGMVAALTEAAPGFAEPAAGPEPGGRAGPGADGQERRFSPALILGGGATATAALAALRAVGVQQVTVAVRDPARAGGLVAVAGRLGMDLRCGPFGARDLNGAALVISTVPAGAADPVADKLVAMPQPPAIVLDVVYAPWPTPLAQAASRRGAVVVSGFELLLHQAARQFELMTGRPAPLAAMRAAGLAEQGRRMAAS
jgi:shikimate dehydrogenase